MFGGHLVQQNNGSERLRNTGDGVFCLKDDTWIKVNCVGDSSSLVRTLFSCCVSSTGSIYYCGGYKVRL